MIKRLSRFNVYIERSKKYVGTVQLFLLISIFITSLGVSLVLWHYILIFIVSPIVFIVVGYFDVKFHIMSEEQKFYGDKNPIFTEFFERLERIEKKL